MRTYLVFIYLVITAITLSACSHRGESTSTVAMSPPPPAVAPPAPPSPSAEPLACASTQAQQAAERSHFNVPPGTSFIASTVYHTSVDAAPGKPASPSLPAGSVYIGYLTARLSNDNKKGRVPMIIEWDVAGGRVLRSVDLSLETHERWTQEMRIATFRDNVYVASTMGERDEMRLFALDADLRPRATRSLGIGERISLEINEKYLAVAYRPTDDGLRPLKVELLDANNLTPIATTSIGTADWVVDWTTNDALEFLGDRLYVAGVPASTAPPQTHLNNPTDAPFVHVFAMSLPALEIVRTHKSKIRSYYLTTLQSAAGHIILTGSGWFSDEELTADLKLIRKHKGAYAEAFDPKTGRAFSCSVLQVIDECCCGGLCSCHAFWTGVEAAIVADINGHIVFGRLKDLPRQLRYGGAHLR
ncbi:MAG: hypothetical protein FWD73_13345 [Polyangiaceae bacterium]|nr:hypothetical protein [Polyangiaceae bacterium]